MKGGETNQSDSRINPHQIPPPTKNGRSMVDEELSACSDMLVRWSQRLNLPDEEIKELVADVQESFGVADSNEEARHKVQDVVSLIERAAVAKHLYIKNGGDWFMADRCMWLLLGMHSAAGVSNLENLVKLVEQCGFGKAAVNKCLQHFQKQVHELPILPGQREMESRLKMKKSRKNQL